MIAPIVLAAGRSSRMGAPKALLTDRLGCPFVVRIARTLGEAGFDEVIVVTSDAIHVAVEQAFAAHPIAPRVRLMRNADPDRGQLSSIWTGMDALPPGTDAMLMTLVDIPFVSTATVRAVVDAYIRSGAAIVRPADGDRHGHPVIFDQSLFAELRAASLEAGGKHVVRAHAHEIRNVPIADEGAFTDIDTPQEYLACRGGLPRPPTETTP